MESNEFVEKLLEETSLDVIEFASDVERILAEQIAYLRDHVRALQQGSVLGTHDVIRQLYGRLEDKDSQIESLREEIGFLRQQLTGASS
jgi:archaellum component FlaC